MLWNLQNTITFSSWKWKFENKSISFRVGIGKNKIIKFSFLKK